MITFILLALLGFDEFDKSSSLMQIYAAKVILYSETTELKSYIVIKLQVSSDICYPI